MATEYKYIPIVYRNKKAYDNYKDVAASYYEKKSDKKNYQVKNVRTSVSASGDVAVSPAGTFSGTAVKPAAKTNIKGVVSTIFVICFVFAMLAIVLAGNAKISSMNIENSQISSEISALESEIEDIKLDITLATDLETIQTRATELGMSCPDSAHVVYLEGER